MKTAQSLPTVFAKQLAVATKLIPEKQDVLNAVFYDACKQRLAAYQQLSIAGTKSDAMLAYHGVELSEDQQVALDLIFDTTKPWLLGHVMGEMLSRMESIGTGAKEALEIAVLFVESFAKATGMPDTQKKQLLVKVFGSGKVEVES